MRKLKLTLLLIFLMLFFSKLNTSYALYDPLSVKNNIYGIHILFTSELDEAATLVNSSGGDWGYVTIPIQVSDKDLNKWQSFMDECAKKHVIPILRIATTGDYFVKDSWSEPTKYDVLDFANFLNSLNWPTKNRYIIIFNEPNRGDEWGGTPNPRAYAEILQYSVEIFKQTNPNFFVIMAGLDNAAANVYGKSIDQYTYMQEMNYAVPGIFSLIDGLASHSYPNPGFSQTPSMYNRLGIYSFYYQNNLIYQLTGKRLPVFITETGWTTDKIAYPTQIDYYKDVFSNYWNDENVVAVTPFLFRADQGPFTQFSFIVNGQQTTLYKAYKGFSKVKGQPQLDYVPKIEQIKNVVLPILKFDLKYSVLSVYNSINSSSKTFFKWLLGL